jgi:hypothetical protein
MVTGSLIGTDVGAPSYLIAGSPRQQLESVVTENCGVDITLYKTMKSFKKKTRCTLRFQVL